MCRRENSIKVIKAASQIYILFYMHISLQMHSAKNSFLSWLWQIYLCKWNMNHFLVLSLEKKSIEKVFFFIKPYFECNSTLVFFFLLLWNPCQQLHLKTSIFRMSMWVIKPKLWSLLCGWWHSEGLKYAVVTR